MVPSITSRFSLKYMEVQGYYVNDLPGLVLDGKELQYLYIYLPIEARPEGSLENCRLLLEKTLEDYSEALNILPFRILYLDDEGHCVCAATEPLHPPILLNVGERTVKGEELAALILSRTYLAQGSKGIKSINFHENLDAYTGVGKFLGLYMTGWAGLFSHRGETDKVKVFEEFSPHKSLFGTNEWVDRPVFRMQLGLVASASKVLFKESVLQYPEATLEEVLSIK